MRTARRRRMRRRMEPEPSASDVSFAGERQRERGRALELCRVERWRGYRSTTFFLRAADGTLYESSSFPWRRLDPPPEDHRARGAFDGLVALLEADGWTLHGLGESWCEATFGRPAAIEPTWAAEPDAEPTPIEPVRQQLRPVRAEPAPPRPAPPAANRRFHPVLLAAAMLVVAVAGVTAAVSLLGGGHPAPAVAPPTTARGTSKPAAAIARAQPRATPAHAVPSRTVDVVVRAVRGNGSWLEARRGSATGRVLFRGVLAPGRTLHLRAATLWARFGAASNLSITQDGRPVTLAGTYDKTFRHRP